jgi:dynein heavy chain
VNKNRLAKGLKTLNETNTAIATLKVTLEDLQPKLEKYSEELAVALVKVTADKAIADEKEAVVAQEAEVVMKQASEAKIISDDAERELARAKPVLAASKTAVESIDRDSITNLSKVLNPNPKVAFIMKGCMTLFGNPKADWKDVMKATGKVQEFLLKLREFKPENVKEKTWKSVRDKYLSDPLFDPVEAA